MRSALGRSVQGLAVLPFLGALACSASITELDGALELPDAGTGALLDAAATDRGAPDAGVELDTGVDAGSADVAETSDGGPPVALRLCGRIGLPLLGSSALAPDGLHVAAGGQNGEIVWLSAGGEVSARASAHHGAVYDVAYSPAGDRVYSYGEDGLVKAFEVASGRELWSQARAARPPKRSRIDVRGGVVAIGGAEVELFDAHSGAPLERLTDPVLDGRVIVAPAVVALGPDGAQVAAAFGSTAVVFDRRRGVRTATYTGDLGTVGAGAYVPEIQSLQFSRDGSALLVAVRRAYVVSPGVDSYPVARIYAVAGGATLSELRGPDSYGVTASFSLDSRHVAVTSGGLVDWWEVQGPAGWILAPSQGARQGARASEVEVGALDRLLLSQGTSGLVLAEAQGEVLYAQSSGDPEGTTLVLSEAGDLVLRSLAPNPSGERLELWRLAPPDAAGQIAATLVLRSLGVIGDLSPDGQWIATTTTGRTLTVAKVDGSAGATFSVVEPRISAISFAADAQSLLIAHEPERSGQLSAMDHYGTRGERLARAEAIGTVGHLGRVSGGWIGEAPSADHFRGAAGVDLWSSSSLAPRRQLLARTWGASGAALSADGRTLLVAPWLEPLMSVDVASGTETVLGQGTRSTRLAFAPDGSYLARVDESGALFVGPPESPSAGVRVPEQLPVGRAYGIARLEVGAQRLVAASSLGELKIYCAP